MGALDAPLSDNNNFRDNTNFRSITSILKIHNRLDERAYLH